MREDVIDEIEKYLDGDMAELPFATKEKIGCTVDYKFIYQIHKGGNAL